jgi:hypothetical protein
MRITNVQFLLCGFRLDAAILFALTAFIVASPPPRRSSRIFVALIVLIAFTSRTSFGFSLLPLCSVSRILELSKLRASSAASPAVERSATATAQVVSGFVVRIIVNDGGAGYTEAPVVQILGEGAGAKAIAQIAGGIVINILVIDAGIGYTSAPEVIVSPPSASGYLSIRPSHIRLDAHVVLGRKYQVETSDDQAAWISALPPFVAENEFTQLIVPSEDVRRYLRIYETE